MDSGETGTPMQGRMWSREIEARSYLAVTEMALIVSDR
jgi:hypothetical protein